MYTKLDLIENRKMEKILRANKYKTREIIRRKNKKLFLSNLYERVFCLLFWSFITYFIYQICAYIAANF